MSRRREYAEFVTGHGLIRESFYAHLVEHGLEPTYKLGNEGVIVVTIE